MIQMIIIHQPGKTWKNHKKTSSEQVPRFFNYPFKRALSQSDFLAKLPGKLSPISGTICAVLWQVAVEKKLSKLGLASSLN